MHLSQRDVVRRAAGIVAPVFEAQQWKWWDKGVPSQQEIAQTINGLLLHFLDPDITSASTGRFRVIRHVDEGGDKDSFDILLELGTVRL